jgi:hypothetical protein
LRRFLRGHSILRNLRNLRTFLDKDFVIVILACRNGRGYHGPIAALHSVATGLRCAEFVADLGANAGNFWRSFSSVLESESLISRGPGEPIGAV